MQYDYFTDDPIRDYDRHLSELDESLSGLPRCELCDERITEDEAVYYNDMWICRDCEHTFWDNIREDFLTEVRDGNS